ncbi:MAG: hypothetical protein D6740_01085, partial [Alphaproteobacteria bacterium]
VASEVKALANQTAKATEDIQKRIDAIQQHTRESVQAIGDIREAIKKVHGTSTAISAAVEEQSASTNEIARSTDEAANGTRDVATHVVEVETNAKETGRRAEEVVAAARGLGALAEQLETASHRFVSEMGNAL